MTGPSAGSGRKTQQRSAGSPRPRSPATRTAKAPNRRSSTACVPTVTWRCRFADNPLRRAEWLVHARSDLGPAGAAGAGHRPGPDRSRRRALAERGRAGPRRAGRSRPVRPLRLPARSAAPPAGTAGRLFPGPAVHCRYSRFRGRVCACLRLDRRGGQLAQRLSKRLSPGPSAFSPRFSGSPDQSATNTLDRSTPGAKRASLPRIASPALERSLPSAATAMKAE